MASFVLSFFPLDVLDGIWDLIESVSEGFLTYSFVKLVLQKFTKTHGYVCFILIPRYNLLKEKQLRGLKEHYTSIKRCIGF